MKKLACLFLVLAASGCPDIKTDPRTEADKGPTVEFDPSNKIVPFPNNLLLDPATGKVNLPAQCGESDSTKAIREGVLNKLDGFGTYEAALTTTFSEAVDMTSLTNRIVLYKRVGGTTPVDPATATTIPVATRLGMTVRFDADCMNPTMVPQLAIVPLVPLDQKSIYTIALLDGIKTATGADFVAAGTWRLIRTAEDPVVIKDGTIVSSKTPLDPADEEDRAALLGIDLLWKAHAGALKFLTDLPAAKLPGNPKDQLSRDKILLAWEFKTQTTTDPLDPAVTGSPASEIDRATGLLGNISVVSAQAMPPFVRTNPPFNTCAVGDSDIQCFLKISLGRGSYAVGSAACAAVGCAAIGEVLGSALISKQYQVDTPNPYTGTGTKPIPGPWGDPNDPAEVKTEAIGVLTTLPTTAAPANGYPVVIFQHALGQSKTTALAIAGRLAGLGFATVAIDAVAHDSRAVRISNDAAMGCGDSAGSQRPDLGPSPVTSPQCYAPFLSTNLAATRDGIRQSVIDQQRLVAALKACGTTACGALKVDATKILYMGQSYGGILGSISVGLATDIKSAVLNVPGAGWADILENTQTLPIRCALVDGLIKAGILTGELSNLTAMPPTGLCTTDAWKLQPGYQQFAVIGRWALDPADPANFTRKLATRRFLIQEVKDDTNPVFVRDTVMPNLATERLGAFVGLMAGTADPCVTCASPPPVASAAITNNPMASKWVQYPTLPATVTPSFPGNTFTHGSLLSPAVQAADHLKGTERMQVDALTYLFVNQ